jgi:hypothetical protein
VYEGHKSRLFGEDFAIVQTPKIHRQVAKNAKKTSQKPLILAVKKKRECTVEK